MSAELVLGLVRVFHRAWGECPSEEFDSLDWWERLGDILGLEPREEGVSSTPPPSSRLQDGNG